MRAEGIRTAYHCDHLVAHAAQGLQAALPGQAAIQQGGRLGAIGMRGIGAVGGCRALVLLALAGRGQDGNQLLGLLQRQLIPPQLLSSR